MGSVQACGSIESDGQVSQDRVKGIGYNDFGGRVCRDIAGILNHEGVGQSVLHSVTGTGLTDLVMERIGSATAEIVSVAVIPVMQVPDTVTTLVISDSVLSGA